MSLILQLVDLQLLLPTVTYSGKQHTEEQELLFDRNKYTN